MYAYRVPPDAGVLLVSYTWEDDALKTISFADEPEAFTKQCVDRLDAILKQATGNSIKPYIDETKAAQVRWVMVPTNRGCSKIYRAHTELENMRIVAYNQNYSNLSHLYFAGESYSLEGGWLEPALRTAMDAIIHLLDHENATFLNGFNIKDHYPRYGVEES